MRLTELTPGSYTLAWNDRDARDWAHRPGAAWPCSALAASDGGWIVVDNNGLCDLSPSLAEVDDSELGAFVGDALKSRNYPHYKRCRKLWPLWEE